MIETKQPLQFEGRSFPIEALKESTMLDTEALSSFLASDMKGHTRRNSIKLGSSEHLHLQTKKILLNEASTLISGIGGKAGNREKVRHRRRSSLLISAQLPKRDSFILTLESLDMPKYSSKQNRRNSFLIASELLGFGHDHEGFDEQITDDVNMNGLNKVKRGFSSRRNSLFSSGTLSKRDSSTTTSEWVDSESSSLRQRRNSLLLASEILSLEDENFELRSNSFHKKEGLLVNTKRRHSRKNSLFLPYEISRRNSLLIPTNSCDLPVESQMQRRNSLFIPSEWMEIEEGKSQSVSKENLFSSKKSKKRNSFLECFDSDCLEELYDHSTCPTKKRRRLSKMCAKNSAKKDENLIVPGVNDFSEKKIERQVPVVTPQSRSSKLISLCQAMKSSEESQIRIHDWDRKMGLRRSHSKTMRNSMRSRKKLLKFCSSQLFMAL